MAIAYEFIWLCKDVARIQASVYVLCDNEEYEISEGMNTLSNAIWIMIDDIKWLFNQGWRD